MKVRWAGPGDRATAHELYTDFFVENPPSPHDPETLEEELAELDEYLASRIALIAEADGQPAGLALARVKGSSVGYISDLYVRPAARRKGVAKALLAEAVRLLQAQEARQVTLNVDVRNTLARTVFERLGFREQSVHLVVEATALEARLAGGGAGETFGSVHVQTDDAAAVERAVRQFLPRIGTSAGTVFSEPRNGWVAVYDELCDREPSLLRRLARELSDRLGAVVLSIGLEDGAVVRYVLFDQGRVADEYASLPEYKGPLPPGDVVAMRANPTVAARLTGADPARVREAAPSGVSASELPAPAELLARVAAVLGVQGAEHGYPGAQPTPHTDR